MPYPPDNPLNPLEPTPVDGSGNPPYSESDLSSLSNTIKGSSPLPNDNLGALPPLNLGGEEVLPPPPRQEFEREGLPRRRDISIVNKNVYRAGKSFEKSKAYTPGNLWNLMKYIDWTSPNGSKEFVYDGESGGVSSAQICGSLTYSDAMKNFASQSNENNILAANVSASQCLPVSACSSNPLLVSSVNEASSVVITSGCIGVSGCEGNPLGVSGNIIVSGTTSVSGNVGVSSADGSLPVSGSVSAIVPNLSSTWDSNNALPVSGCVGVSSCDDSLPVSGNVSSIVTNLSADLASIKSNSDSAVDNTASRLTLIRKVANNDALGLEVQTGNGGLTVSSVYSPANATLSSVLVDLDTAGGSPVTDTVLVAAQGADTRISVYGWNLSVVGTTAPSFGSWVITNGAVTNAKYLAGGMVAGNALAIECKDLTLPLACDDNTALMITTTETTGNIYIYGTVQYRIEAT